MGAAAVLDAMRADEARAALHRCCGCARWADDMVRARPFGGDEQLHAAADLLWSLATPEEILEALAHHPQIGADLEVLRQKFAATAGWSGAEQSGVASADSATLVALRDGNVAYAEKFGFVFVVCATGKSAAEMLELLRARLPNDRDTELRNAAHEQNLITHIRLDKLVGDRA